MRRLLLTLGVALAFGGAGASACPGQAESPLHQAQGPQAPTAEISNGIVKAKLYLPDAEHGYYQGTRFDWSGAIASLEANGHNYFGVWFEKYDPKANDAITGPVEEFITAKRSALGYDEAKPGEKFVKIGVGALKKPEEQRYSEYKTYEIADHGKRSVRKGRDFVEFTQTLADTNGYAYIYRKTVRLAKGKPEMALEHSLKNTGRKTIETSVYEHNFYVIDNLPTGPDVVVRFPFDVRARDMRGLAEARGKELVFLKELQARQSASSELEGFGPTPSDYDIRVENRKAGAGVRQTSDRPIARMFFWSIRTTPCPEAYIGLKVEPGKETKWRINYEFYTLKP
jgi:hypothetical protein